LFSIFGNVSFADRIEQLTFNALPAAFTANMWSHVYLQQGNQINAQHCDPSIYVTDGPDSNIFGLEPNYGCCTVNHPQGWPKFVTSLYMKTQDDGIVVVSYAPSELTTTINGQAINILLQTDYPFNETLIFIVNTTIEFPLYLRAPGWCQGATIQVNSEQYQIPNGTLYPIQVAVGQTTIVLTLPMSFYITSRYNDAVAIYRGPLVFVLEMEQNFTELSYRAYNSTDWQIEPITPWNYGVLLNTTDVNNSIKVSLSPVGTFPYSHAGAPVKAYTQGRIIPEWVEETNAAAAPPQSPVSSTQPLTDLTLIPFGATQLRIVEFPLLSN